MIAELWSDVDRDIQSSLHHFRSAIELFEEGFDRNDEKTYYVRTMAFLHAMQAGYTSFEAGIKRLLSMLGESLPSDFDSHAALIRRIATPAGSRPAILNTRVLRQAADTLRGFRQVAIHVYDHFDEDRARLAVQDAHVFLVEIEASLSRFRAVIDPD